MADIIMAIVIGEVFNVIIGLVGYIIAFEVIDDLSDFEDNHPVLIGIGGIIYWLLRLIIYPMLIPFKRNKKKRDTIKEYQEHLIRKIDGYYSTYYNGDIEEIQIKIEKMKQSESNDLYIRSLDSYKDLMTILIKCSDGKGDIDIAEFNDIIKESVKECKEIVEIAYDEYKDRLDKANKLYNNNKKEEVKQTLENMKNKNKIFKDIWSKNK